eukprot:scaffold34682_cov243-Amphora_coffeaeformis.AAC.6
MVLLQDKDFDEGKGLFVHIRTTITDSYSYIEAVAIQVGDSTLEFYPDHMTLNGDKVVHDDLPVAFGSGLEFTLNCEPESKKHMILQLNDQAFISITSYSNFMRVSFTGTAEEYGNSVGLLGEFSTGNMLGRHGQLIENVMEYGFEWQVNEEDKVLFSEVREPQLPYEKCRMPTTSVQARRRLKKMDNSALAEEAQAACNGLNDFELCVSDILMTGDLGMAQAFM